MKPEYWQRRNDLLTEQQVLRARRRARDGETLTEIAAGLRISRNALRAAICGQSWKHLDPIEAPVAELAPSTNRGNRRFTEHDIRTIRKRHAEGEDLGVIAEDYRMTRVNAWYIVNRRTWLHVTD